MENQFIVDLNKCFANNFARARTDSLVSLVVQVQLLCSESRSYSKWHLTGQVQYLLAQLSVTLLIISYKCNYNKKQKTSAIAHNVMIAAAPTHMPENFGTEQ